MASKKSTNALLPSADGLAAAAVDDVEGFGVLEPFAEGDLLPEEAELDAPSTAAKTADQYEIGAEISSLYCELTLHRLALCYFPITLVFYAILLKIRILEIFFQ